MKKYILISISCALIISCSNDNPDIAPEQEEKIDLAPGEFKVTVVEVSDNRATINWEEAIDPEAENVTYTILLNGEIKKENIEEREFEFTGLSELTRYTCKVIAKDINDNKNFSESTFITKKFYTKYLKEYFFENSETGSYGIPSHMTKTFDGNYVITGTSSTKEGGYQSFALKIDEDGNEIWKHFYGNEVNQVTNVTQTLDGGFILVAFHMILKINANGNEEWRTVNENYIHPDYSHLVTLGEMFSVKEDSKGNIFVVGWRGVAVPDPTISHFGVLTKISSSGEIIWEKEFRDSYRSSFDDLIIDEEDNIIIFGTADPNPGDEEKVDFWLLKTDSSGNILWKRILFSQGYAFARKIIKTNDNNYAIVGFSWGAYDIGSGAIFKITPEGNEIWSNQISLSSVLSINETSDGGFIAIGHIDSSNFDTLGISKLTPGGNEEWTRSYLQSFTHLRGKAIFQTQDQGFLFTTSSFKNYYYGDDRAKILVFKTDPEGNYE